MSQEIVGTAVNTYNGKKFRYNEIIVIGEWNAPLLSTTRSHRWLHPSKTDLATLRKLNPDKSNKETADYFDNSRREYERVHKEIEQGI